MDPDRTRGLSRGVARHPDYEHGYFPDSRGFKVMGVILNIIIYGLMAFAAHCLIGG